MAVSFDNSEIFQIQQANDIIDVITEHVALTKKGREMVGLCPFHDDHTPSMYVNPTKQIFKCFACGAGGDIFKFVQMRENLSFPQAVQRLAERAGIKIKKTFSKKQNNNTSDIDPIELAKINEWASKYFHENLIHPQKGKAAREYLEQRKISNQSIEKFRIGLALNNNSDLTNNADKKHISKTLLEQAGLATINNTGRYSDKFVNRLMFTITDGTKRVIAFGGRTLAEHPAKYINSPATILFDKSNCLYGIEQARHEIVSTGTAVVVEGYTDCIIAHQFQCNNVVATLGTSFTQGHARILKRYAKKIVLIFDSDEAGLEASNRALEVCLAQKIDIKVAFVPSQKDPCDFILAKGKEKFQALIDNALDVLRFKWDRLNKKFQNQENLIDNKAAFEEYLQSIATAIHSQSIPPIEKGLIVNRLTKIIGLDAKQINAELKRRVAGVAHNSKYSDSPNTQNQKVCDANLGNGFFAAAQRELLEILLNRPELFDSVKKDINHDLFDVPFLKKIAEILFDAIKREQKPILNVVLAAVQSVEAGNCIVDLAQKGEEKENYEKRLKDVISAFKRQKEIQTQSQLKKNKDDTEFLKTFAQNTSRENPHKIGMT
jgi:DNA primase